LTIVRRVSRPNRLGAAATTFEINELMATKHRAIFDLPFVLEQLERA